MYSTIRKIRKNKKAIFLKRASIFIVVVSGVFFLIYYLITDVFKIKDQILSPLALSKSFTSYSVDAQILKSNIEYDSIKKGKDFYSIDLKDNGIVILSARKDIEKQISSLQLILSRLTIEGKRFKSLDFRFDKPVLVF